MYFESCIYFVSFVYLLCVWKYFLFFFQNVIKYFFCKYYYVFRFVFCIGDDLGLPGPRWTKGVQNGEQFRVSKRSSLLTSKKPADAMSELMLITCLKDLGKMLTWVRWNWDWVNAKYFKFEVCWSTEIDWSSTLFQFASLFRLANTANRCEECVFAVLCSCIVKYCEVSVGVKYCEVCSCGVWLLFLPIRSPRHRSTDDASL